MNDMPSRYLLPIPGQASGGHTVSEKCTLLFLASSASCRLLLVSLHIVEEDNELRTYYRLGC
jgi:hypothetical protein